MVHSNSEFMHLCLSLLEKLRDEKLRNVLIDEAIGFVTRPVEGRMPVDVYSRYLFYKVLGEVYYAGVKAGHAAVGVTAATGSQMTRKAESCRPEACFGGSRFYQSAEGNGIQFTE